jgi:hypothetical protein
MASEKEVTDLKNSPLCKEIFAQPEVNKMSVERDEQGQYFLNIGLDTDDPKVHEHLAKKLEGHPVRLERGGPYHKLPTKEKQ